MTRFLTTLALAAAVSLGGCSDDGTGPENRVEGTYALETINGDELPVTLLETGEFKIEVLAGSVRLMDDNEFTASLSFRETSDGEVDTYTQTDTGTWSRSGNTITFSYEDAELDDDVATYSNGKLTLEVEDGLTLVFEK